MNSLPYPFGSGQWHLHMGTKPLAVADWIDRDAESETELALKEQLLRDCPTQVFVSLPGSEPAQAEFLDLLLKHLHTFFPDIYQIGSATVENRSTGQNWTLDNFATAPLKLAGLLVQEDWLLLRSGEGGYTLAAGFVCFPLRWSLPEKLGQPLTQIHQPVPGYNPKLSRPVDALFAHLKPENPVWRINWTIVDTPELFLPPERDHQGSNHAIALTDAGEKLWLRLEKQTLRRLPQTGYILFGIHSYLQPLHRLRQQPLMATQLAQTISTMPEPMLAYKNLVAIRPALLGYLQHFGIQE